jgi:hypothetical protein
VEVRVVALLLVVAVLLLVVPVKLGKVDGGVGVCAHAHEENCRHTVKKPGNRTTRDRMNSDLYERRCR